jgi:hypothetical protein
VPASCAMSASAGSPPIALTVGAFPFKPAGVIQFMTAVPSDRRKSMKHGTVAHGAAKQAMEMSSPSRKVVVERSWEGHVDIHFVVAAKQTIQR